MIPPKSGLLLARWQRTVKDNLYRLSRGKRKCSGMGHHHLNMWGWRERLGIGCKHRREYTLKVLQGEQWLAILPPIEGGLTKRRPPYMETRCRTCHRYLGGLGNINIKAHQKRKANEWQPLTSNTAGTSRLPQGAGCPGLQSCGAAACVLLKQNWPAGQEVQAGEPYEL